jgi:hypothetical protein
MISRREAQLRRPTFASHLLLCDFALPQSLRQNGNGEEKRGCWLRVVSMKTEGRTMQLLGIDLER